MKRTTIYWASAALGAALMASSPASAAEVGCWYNGAMHSCIYYPGYAYEYAPGYGIGTGLATGIGAIAAAPFELASDVTAPLMTGRSVAVSAAPGAGAGPGDYCSTPVKTCRLHEPGWLGTGCSCKVPGGRARGYVE